MRGRLIREDQLARALGIPVEFLASRIAQLRRAGFPDPVTDDGSHWDVEDLLDWVVKQQDELVLFIMSVSDCLQD